MRVAQRAPYHLLALLTIRFTDSPAGARPSMERLDAFSDATLQDAVGVWRRMPVVTNDREKPRTTDHLSSNMQRPSPEKHARCALERCRHAERFPCAIERAAAGVFGTWIPRTQVITTLAQPPNLWAMEIAWRLLAPRVADHPG